MHKQKSNTKPRDIQSFSEFGLFYILEKNMCHILCNTTEWEQEQQHEINHLNISVAKYEY